MIVPLSKKRIWLARALGWMLGVVCLFCAGKSAAQWKKIFDFGSNVVSIYFMNTSDQPTIGFVGTHTPTIPNCKMWRTTDGGMNWVEIFYPPDGNGQTLVPMSFTFKNNLEGWFSYFSGSCYRTTDGGFNWQLVAPDATELCYVPSTNLVIGSVLNSAATFGSDYIYSKDGVNFTGVNLPLFFGGVSITFSDEMHGIMSSGNPFTTNIAYTADGGLSWHTAPLSGEFFSPVGIPGTKTFFAISEAGGINPNMTGKVVRSDDGGINWSQLYAFHSTSSLAVTGCMQYGINMSLFFQTGETASEGIMMSQDSGVTFHSICGPVGYNDTRFFVRDSFIYAADNEGGLFLNTTGIGSNSTPQVSSTSLNFKPIGCKPIDSIITLTFFDSCNGIQANLKNISLLTDGKFSFVSGGNVRQLHENDSIVVRYDPQASGSDTAFLKLTFHLGFKDFDTTVLLAGIGGNGAEHVMFSMGTGDSSLVGYRVGVPIYPDVTLSGIGLTSVSFDLTYNGDLLGQPQCASGSPYNSICSIGNEIVNGKTTTLPVTITGSDISLDHLTPLASITFTSYLTDTNSTRIVMTNLKLNNGDPDYAQCVLSADTTSTSYKEIYRCTEPTLQQFLKTKTVLFITSMRPNPAEDNITVEVRSGIEQDVVVKVIDALGCEVKKLIGHFHKGVNELAIDLSGEAAGVYVLQVGEISEKFVVKR